MLRNGVPRLPLVRLRNAHSRSAQALPATSQSNASALRYQDVMMRSIIQTAIAVMS